MKTGPWCCMQNNNEAQINGANVLVELSAQILPEVIEVVAMLLILLNSNVSSWRQIFQKIFYLHFLLV